jgi:seryl-tRNA synthetase
MATNKAKSPEEIMKEIERLKKEYEKAEVELKESRRASVTEAVRKAGPDFEEKFKVYLGKRKTVHTKQEQVDKMRGEIQSDLQYLKDQYKFIRDMLVGEGAKEEYLVDVLGEPPTVKAAAVPGTGTKKRTKAKLPDGTTSTWNDLLTKHGIVHKEGNSAHREWDAAVAANPNLPKIEVVTVE